MKMCVFPSSCCCTDRGPSHTRHHAGEDCLKPGFRNRARHLSGTRFNYRSVCSRSLNFPAESACHPVGELPDLSGAVVLAGALHPNGGEAVSRCASAIVACADFDDGPDRLAARGCDAVADGSARHFGLAADRSGRNLSSLFPAFPGAAPGRRLIWAASEYRRVSIDSQA